MWKGIDVSDNQGVIDWEQVAASKVAFAILRSVRRSGKEDHQFAANLEGCRKQINRNMRCIEILMPHVMHLNPNLINRNMRCIEISAARANNYASDAD